MHAQYFEDITSGDRPPEPGSEATPEDPEMPAGPWPADGSSGEGSSAPGDAQRSRAMEDAVGDHRRGGATAGADEATGAGPAARGHESQEEGRANPED
eukprot:8702528-Lingulodinium_polyedra.AAC.1